MMMMTMTIDPGGAAPKTAPIGKKMKSGRRAATDAVTVVMIRK